jgi:SWIM zinc finger
MVQPRCPRCGRFVTLDQSMAKTFCPRCVVILNEAAAQIAHEYSRAQVSKAAELLKAGRLVCIDRGMYRVESATSSEIYWTGTKACSCPAGSNRRPCYHVCAVRLRELTPVR